MTINANNETSPRLIPDVTKISSRNFHKDKTYLWTNSWSSKRLSFQLSIIVTCVGMFLGVAGIFGYIHAPFAKELVDQEWIWRVIFFGSIILGFIFVLNACYAGHVWRAIWKRSRSPLLLDSFIMHSKKLDGIDLNWIRVIREKLGTAYHINPDLIYPEDTPRLLRKLCEAKDPYGFEVILESAHQFDVELTDLQVEQITQKIHRQGRNVADLIEVVAHSLALIKEKTPLIQTITRFRCDECLQLLTKEITESLSCRQKHLLRRTIKFYNFKEPRLWADSCYSWKFSQIMILTSGFLGGAFIIHSTVIKRYHLPFSTFDLFIFIFVLSCYLGFLGYSIFPYFYRIRHKRKCSPVNLDPFIERSKELTDLNADWVKIIRERLGSAYQIPPELIYPEDTPLYLQKLQSYPPFGFEIVLGSANQLGFILSDEQVDLIIQGIHKEAHNVAGLIHIIAQELQIVIDKGQDNIRNA